VIYMGKRLIVQRRGKGGSVFKSPRWKHIAKAKYRKLTNVFYKKTIVGYVVDLLHEPGRTCPIMKVKFEDNVTCYLPAPEGIAIGQKILYGAEVPPNLGNILALKNIPDGSRICNVELAPGDGGKIARASGTYAIVLTHTNNKVLIQLPSKRTKEIDGRARAMIGIISAGGRIEKPLLKAGKAYHISKSKSWKYPTVRGKAMSPYAHPAGGGSHPKGLTPAPRNAPPGAKVGHIAPKRTGRRKGK